MAIEKKRQIDVFRGKLSMDASPKSMGHRQSVLFMLHEHHCSPAGGNLNYRSLSE